MDEKRQIQKELFDEFAQPDKKRQHKALFPSRQKRIVNLSYEHLVFIVMAFIITAAVSFSFGVERGKHLKPKTKEHPRQVIQQDKEEAPVQATEQAKEEEAASEPAKVPEAKSDVKIYTVQVASYATKDAADIEIARLDKKGFKAFALLKGRYYIVCVGEFKNKRKASSLEKRLKKQYRDCYIREK